MPKKIGKALAAFETNIARNRSLDSPHARLPYGIKTQTSRCRASPKGTGGQYSHPTRKEEGRLVLQPNGATSKVLLDDQPMESLVQHESTEKPTTMPFVDVHHGKPGPLSPRKGTHQFNAGKAIYNSPTGSTESLSDASPIKIRPVQPRISEARSAEQGYSSIRSPCFSSPVKQPGRCSVLVNGRKQYPKSPAPNKKRIASFAGLSQPPCLADSNTSSSATEKEESNEPILVHDASNKVLSLHTRAVLSPLPLRSAKPRKQDFMNLSRRQVGVLDPVDLLHSRWRPASILHVGQRQRNKTRRVRFADMQPGGGRRMSADCLIQKDLLPQRPRRLSLQMTDLRGKEMGCDFRLAALKIQATFRGWVQWRTMRAELLELRLARIEHNKIVSLKNIRDEKWKTMEGIRDEMEDESKRLESQVSLGEKLIEHLKRDNSQITDETKKLRDHCRTLEKNIQVLESSVQVSCENFDAVCALVEVLEDNRLRLKNEKRDCRQEIECQRLELDEVTLKIKQEFHSKKKIKTTLGKIVKVCRSCTNDRKLAANINELMEAKDQISTTDLKQTCRIVRSKRYSEIGCKGYGTDDTSSISDATTANPVKRRQQHLREPTRLL